MGDIRWKGLDHEAIHKMINLGPGPSASGPQAEFWGTLSTGLNDISTKLHDKLNSLKVAWDGQSSEAAQAGMSPLKDWASNAESGSNVMKTSFELQGNYVGEARAEVPKPVEVTTPQPSGWQVAGAVGALVTGNAGPAAAVAAQSADHEAQERAKDEAARQAVQAMTKYESSSDWNADTLGQFDTPPQVVVDTPPPAGGGSVNVVQTHGTLNNTSTVQHNTLPPVDSTTHSQSTMLPVNTPPQTHTPPTPPPTTPQHVAPPTPIQQFPPTPQPKPPFIPPQPPPGGPGGPGGPGFPGGGPFVPGGYNTTGGPGGGPGSGPGTGGRSGLGQGGRGGAGGGSGFGQNAVDSEGRQLGRGGAGGGNPLAQEGMGRGGPGGGNLSGGGGRGTGGQMGPGGRRADGEDDDEHETPDYLLETEDVFGDERMVAPPVIGEKREQ